MSGISTRAWTIAYKMMGAFIAILIIGALALVSFNNAQLRAENQAMYLDLQSSQENALRLYDQLLEIPGVEPDGEKPEDVSAAPGAPGASGPRGEPGRPPTTGEVVAAVTEACTLNSFCIGPVGPVGTPGEQGAPGQPGAPGAPGDVGQSIVGPEGPSGPAGSAGADGQPGSAGAPGAPGAAGPACTDGYIPQIVQVLTVDGDPQNPTPRQAILCLPSNPSPDQGETSP